MNSLLGVEGSEPGPGLLHACEANPASPEGTCDMQIVAERPPPGILSAVCAIEPSQFVTGNRQLDELIIRRVIKPLAPNAQALPGQISVKQRVVKRAPMVLPPATRVEVRNGLRVRRSCAPILDHPDSAG